LGNHSSQSADSSYYQACFDPSDMPLAERHDTRADQSAEYHHQTERVNDPGRASKRLAQTCR
jgi:hypothetical protein